MSKKLAIFTKDNNVICVAREDSIRGGDSLRYVTNKMLKDYDLTVDDFKESDYSKVYVYLKEKGINATIINLRDD